MDMETEGNVEDMVTTTHPQISNIFTENVFIIPLVCGLGGIVLILSIILIAICCRRKIRARRMAAADDINIKVIKNSSATLDLNDNGNHGLASSVSGNGP